MAQQTQKKTTGTRSRASGTGGRTSGTAARRRTGSETAARRTGSTSGTSSRSGASSSRTGGRTPASRRHQDSRTASRARRAGSGRETEGIRTDLALIILLAAMVFVFLANFRIMGPVGNAVSGVLFGLFGFPNYILPPFVFLAAAWYFAGRDSEDTLPRIISGAVLILLLGIVCELITGDLKDSALFSPGGIFQRCRDGRSGGGLLAGSITWVLYRFLKGVGTILVVIMAGLICVIVFSGHSMMDMMESGRVRGYDDPERDGDRRFPEEGPGGGSFRGEEDDLREEEDEREEYYRLRAEERDRRRQDAESRRRELEEDRRRREEERSRKRREAEEREIEEERRRRQERQEEENRRLADSIVRKAPAGEYDNYFARAALTGTSAAEESSARSAGPASPSDFGMRDGAGIRITRDRGSQMETASDCGTDACLSAAGQALSAGASGASSAAAAAVSGPSGVISSASVAAAQSAAGGGNNPPEQSRADTAGESVRKPSEENYSVSQELHEITAANSPEYREISLRADLEDGKRQKSMPAYSGIGVPAPQETNPDYSSDSFAEKVIRQGLEESLSYQQASLEEDSRRESAETAVSAPESGTLLHAAEGTSVPNGTDSAAETSADVSGMSVPASETTVPASETSAPASETTAPAAEKSAQDTEMTARAAGTSVPATDKSAQNTETTAKASETPAPASKSSADASDIAGEQTASPSPATEQELSEIQVEREHRAPGASSGGSVPFRDNSSGTTFGGGIAEAQRQRDEREQKAESRPREPYVFPPLSLLHQGSHNRSEETDRELQETAYNLQNTLKTFGVDVTIPQVSQGPAVTRYELLPAQGVKVSRIVSLADDIKLNLAAADIRIEAPIPGKQAIGIEVPNRHPAAVPLRDLFESDAYRSFKGKIRFGVGKDIGGNVVVADIARMPHMLIAGSTGSGKSVCINTIIMSILYSYRPDEVKMIMIDPKIVELSVYNGIPHLLLPVVTDPKKAAGALQWAVAEMTDRYRKFAEESVRDLKGYNEKMREEKKCGAVQGDRSPLPQIVIIVDELADLMMVSAKEVEEAICRLAQLARAAGIHLIIATQRPSVDVITGLIKANMPSRIAFAVSSGVDSRTILDMYGAEKLLGKGDMLFYPQGYSKPARVQGAFVSDGEVQDVADFVRYHNSTWADGNDIEKTIETMNTGSDNSGGSAVSGGTDSQYDEHFVEAGYLIIEKKKASIGMLQRVFKIGFNRAARIMDQLCEAGVVSQDEGTRARQVLMSRSDFESFIEENEI